MRDGMVKLGDFGIAKVLNNTKALAKTMVGTPYYLSPEIVENKPYHFATDIWSIGVILYELCALRPPFDGKSLDFLCMKILKGRYKQIPSMYSRNMRDLISKLLTVQPKRRLKIHQILKLPIIQKRIKSFLNETVMQKEFCHTILHNKILFRRGPKMNDIK